MCGIFGLIRNLDAPHPERASAAFVELGKHSVERGRDSAGFALHTYAGARSYTTGPTYRDVDARETVIDGVRIIKDTCSFHDLWDDDQHLPLLATSQVAVGHTRWATQGKRDARTNASPLLVGSLIGTHNGDLNTRTVKGHFYLPKPMGGTDTEVLYQALDRDRRDRRKVTDVLRNVEGRAALAWLDRTHPDRVYLARAALSPLAIAFDAEGNLYWASNPRWFRDIDTQFDHAIGFRDIILVTEGTLLTVSLTGTEPVIEDMREFTPTCRASDARLSDAIVWRGFDSADIDTDKGQTKHKVAPARPKTKTTVGAGAGYAWGDGSYGAGHWGSAKGTAPTTSRGLPDYSDALDGITAARYTQQTGAAATADRWAELEPEHDTLFGGLASDDTEEVEVLDEDEAIAATEKWFEDGCDATIVTALRSASLPSEIDNLCTEFDLSSKAAFHLFREMVLDWYGELTSLESSR